MSATTSAAGRHGDPPLRVALVGEYPISEEAILEGGVQSVTHALAHALARRHDIECHVVSAMLGVTTDYRRVGHLHVHYVRRPPVPRLVSGKYFDAPALAKVVRSIKPDVVHGQGQDRHALGALRAGYPTVITPHGVLFIESRLLQRHRYDFVGAMKGGIINGWEREVFRRANHMILISRYLPQIYGAMVMTETTFIDNPINPAYFSLPRAPDPGRLMFVGTIVPRKCVHDLVLAFSHLRQMVNRDGGPDAPWKQGLQLRIAGPLLHPPTEQQLRKSIVELGLEQYVKLLGPVSEVDLRNEYSKAQLLLLSSREETAPQVIAQAMACGLPTVAAASGGVPAMIRDGETGTLFPFGNPVKCGEQILRLLQDGSLLNAISQRIIVEGRQRFHPDSVAQQTADVYRRVLSQATR